MAKPDDPVVRVKRRGEEPPGERCHYCGEESADLVTEVIGDKAWRITRTRHPEGTCPPLPRGWATCYRCDRALAPDEQRAITLRMDTALGRMREERTVRTTTKAERWEPWADHISTGQHIWHAHPWEGAVLVGPDHWVSDRSKEIEDRQGYEGPPIEGCPQCGGYPADNVVEESEWADFVAVLDDGTEVPYVDAYPAEERVRCDRDGCAHASEEHARGEPTKEDLDREAEAEGRREAAMARLPGHEWWRDHLPATIAEFRQRTGRSDKWCRDTLRDAVEAKTVNVNERRDRKGGSATKVYSLAAREDEEQLAESL